MNAKEAAELINNNGGDISKIPSTQLFDVLRALHGNFEFSADYKKVFDFLDKNKDIAEDVFSQKATSLHVQTPADVINADASSFEELDFKRDVTQLFGTETELKALDDKLADMFRSYSSNKFEPSLADVQDVLSLVGKVGKGSFSGNESAKFQKEMMDLKDRYLLAEGSDKWDLLTGAEIKRNISDLETIYSKLDADEKEISLLENIQIENHIGNKLSRASDKAENWMSSPNEWLPSEKYRKELEAYLNDEATRKVAMDPDFSKKSDDDKKLYFLNVRSEVAKDYVRELVLNQEAFDYTKKFSGTPTKADIDGFNDKAKDIIKNLEDGIVPDNFKIKREIALATLNEGIRNSTAVAKEIFKKTKVKDFYEKAKARQERFAKDHPAIYKAGKSLAIAAAIGGVTVFVSSGLGSALSTAYAVHKTHTAYKALKSKYVNDPLYKDKSFKEYIADHKLETAALAMTGVMAAFPAFGFAGKLGLIESDKAAMRIARGTAVLALGVTNATNMFIKAKTKKEKVMAFAVLGASVVGSAAAIILPTVEGKELMNKVSEKIGSFFGGSKVSESVLEAKIGSEVKSDSISTAPHDTIVAKTDTIHAAKGGSTQVVPEAKGGNTQVAPEAKSGNGQAVEQHVSARSDVGQGNISDKDWSRIKIRSVQTYGAEQVKEWNININSGQVEAIPDGMSKEEFIYKLGQLQKLAPVVHKESINLMLRDLNCDGTVLTTEQIAQVQESLKTIDIKGEYHGFEPTDRTCNRVTGIKVNVNCDDNSVKVKQTVEYGDCNNNKQPAPVQNNEPIVRQETPAVEPRKVDAPVAEPLPTKQAEVPEVKGTPVVETQVPVAEVAAGKEIEIKGTVTNTKGVMGDGKDITALDKMAAKGVVGEEFHGDKAPEILNDARVELDVITREMLAKNELVEFTLDGNLRNGPVYRELLQDASEKYEIVAAPMDTSTGKITYEPIAPENEKYVELVKKGSPLHTYMVEQQAKAKASAVQQAISVAKGRY